MSMIYMLDREDDASDVLNAWIRKERGVTSRDIVRVEAADSLLTSIKGIEFEAPAVDFYVPTLWAGMTDESPYGMRDVEKVKRNINSEQSLRFFFPFRSLQLIDIIKVKPTEQLRNGDCSHREIDGEQCGICNDCIEKFLCYKLTGRETEDYFLEDPFDGYGSRQRIMQILGKLSQNQFGRLAAPNKQEISIGSLVVKAFFKGILPKSLSDAMEMSYQILLTEYAE